ncbi:MAG TPA: MFS transporter, partial [bacterium]|nr:MFS transporter [bacterium]
FLLGPVAGFIADRFDRRRLVMLTQFVSAAIATLLAALTLTGHIAAPHILLLALLLGCTNAVDMPVRQSFVVELVGRRDLGTAIPLNSAMFNGARLLGPAVAGALIPLVGEGWCFMLNALSYVPVLIGLAHIRILTPAPKTQGKSFMLATREGVHYVRRSPAIAILLTTLVIASFAGMPYLVVLPVYADRVLHGGPDTLGLLMAASGAGAFFGALALAGRHGFRGLPQLTLAGGVLFGAALFLLAWLPAAALAIPVLMIAGIGFMVQHASCNSLVQVMVRSRLRGRVMSLYIMVFAGAQPLGSMLAGWCCDHLGVQPVLAGAGLIVFTGTLLCARPLLRYTAAR